MSRTRAAVARVRNPGDKLMVFLIAGGGLITQFLTMVSGIIMARMLGVEGRGQVVLVAVLAQMVSQLTLGGSLPNAITKELAARGLRARDGLHGLVGRWFGWALLAGAGAAAYFLVSERDDLGAATIALAVGTALIAVQSMASRILIGSMLGEGADSLKIAMTGILPQLAATLVLGTAYALGLDWGPVEIIGVIILIQGLVLATRWPALAKPTGRVEDRLDRRELARLARQTHIGSVGPLDGLGLDRALVGALLSSTALGLYSTAVALGSLNNMLGLCVAMVALPRIAAAQNTDPANEHRVVRTWLIGSAALIVPATLVFLAANPVIIPLLFGDDFSDAVPCGYWYVAASGLLAFRRVLIVALQGRGRGRVASIIELALTPFVVAAVYAGALTDDLEVVGMGMVAVALCSVSMLMVALSRSAKHAAVGSNAQVEQPEVESLT